MATELRPIEERTYEFAIRVVKLVQAMPDTIVGRTLGRQVLKSGTSIGANVEEAIGASSRPDFANKMSISLKEARETHYWLRLIRDAGLFQPAQMEDIIQEALELKKILSKTVKTARQDEVD